MASSNNNMVISFVSPHTIKKFELIESYVKSWAHKLLEYGRKTGKCEKIVFIDCMCNSGLYHTKSSDALVEGTPIRVARVLSDVMREKNYQSQQAVLYFNDLSQDKIDELSARIPSDTHNFKVLLSVGDGNELLKRIGRELPSYTKTHYLLVYDPYQAVIDWTALWPFIQNWGEIILNHMVSDSIRAVPQAKKPSAITKYESTYLAKIEDLVNFGSDRNAFEQRIIEIINTLKGFNRHYYIASYPFFNSRNTVVYNLIHCTSNIEGFKLYKSTAWKTFGDKSSMKIPDDIPGQLALDMVSDLNDITMTTATDEKCYLVQDIVKFIASVFNGRRNVTLKEIWNTLDKHPVFPSDLYKNEIKTQLKNQGFKVHQSYVDFVIQG